MKFARQFAAVLLVVVAVVALGTAWAHSSESDWIFNPPPAPPGVSGPRFTKVPSGHGPGGRVVVIRPGAKLPPGAHGDIVRIRAGGGGGAGFDPADSGNLIRTAEIEGAVIAGIVLLDLIRRRYRRAKRARQLAALD